MLKLGFQIHFQLLLLLLLSKMAWTARQLLKLQMSLLKYHKRQIVVKLTEQNTRHLWLLMRLVCVLFVLFLYLPNHIKMLLV